MQHVLNLVLVGNVGNNPELKTGAEGTKYTKLSVAHDHEWRSQGEKKKRTYWYDVLCWGTLAEIVVNKIRKGDSVLVQSDEIDSFTWVTPEGEPKSRVTITASNVTYLRSPSSQSV